MFPNCIAKMATSERFITIVQEPPCPSRGFVVASDLFLHLQTLASTLLPPPSPLYCYPSCRINQRFSSKGEREKMDKYFLLVSFYKQMIVSYIPLNFLVRSHRLAILFLFPHVYRCLVEANWRIFAATFTLVLNTSGLMQCSNNRQACRTDITLLKMSSRWCNDLNKPCRAKKVKFLLVRIITTTVLQSV